MRLDKFLCEGLGLSRSDVKKIIAKNRIAVNGNVIKDPAYRIDENADIVTADGKSVIYEPFVYYMLNKPAGLVSANSDSKDHTVIDLFKDEGRKNLSCVGRLDKDTTGLLIVTDDGDMIHRLTSPRKHVFKDYLVTLDHPLTDEDREALERGVDIGDEKPTLPAKTRILEDGKLILSVSEGRFHQVKRMLISVGNEVKALKRLSMGNVVLDESLKPGEFRRLTKEEIADLSQGRE